MSTPIPQKLDLASLFASVTGDLVTNQETFNQADTYNHNHGDNMVEIFKVITEAMETKPDAEPADQLAYASELLRQRSQSGSAAMYADGLAQASQQFMGKAITPQNALMLIQALLGGPQGQVPQQTQTQPSNDLLGSLISGFSGGQQAPGQDSLDIGDLMTAGMAFLNAKQQGGSDIESLVNVLVSSSQAGQSQHRAQSGALVANTLLKLIASSGRG